MIIDTHGHTTMAPPALEAWRNRQVAAFEGNARRVYSRLGAALDAMGMAA